MSSFFLQQNLLLFFFFAGYSCTLVSESYLAVLSSDIYRNGIFFHLLWCFGTCLLFVGICISLF